MMMVKRKATGTGTIFDRCRSLVDDRAAVRALSVAGLSDNPAPCGLMRVWSGRARECRAIRLVRHPLRRAGAFGIADTPEHGPPQTERTV